MGLCNPWSATVGRVKSSIISDDVRFIGVDVLAISVDSEN